MTAGVGAESTVWQSLLFVGLGWLLGLLGPVIVDAIRRHYVRDEIRTAIVSELSEARFRFAGVVYILQARFGTYDRQLLEWLLPLVEDYRGPNRNQEIAEVIRRQLALSDAELAKVAQQQQAGPEAGLAVKKYRLPYLESHVPDLGLFKERPRALILDIRSNVDLFNEQVDEALFYFKLTYESGVSVDNHHRAVLAVKTSYMSLATRAREIIERVGELLRVTQSTP